MEVLDWLVNGTGLSAKAIALATLGKVPERPNYPHDGDDFGRCYRILKDVPDARNGLERLGRDGGPVWAALISRWSEIETAYLHDIELYERKGRNAKGYRCYDLMQSIIRPIEDADRRTIRMKGATIHF